jgi:hypothetical protein
MSVGGVIAAVIGAIVVGALLFWLNAWLLMWLWNFLAVNFHWPLIKWIHAAAVLLILGIVRGAVVVKEKS